MPRSLTAWDSVSDVTSELRFLLMSAVWAMPAEVLDSVPLLLICVHPRTPQRSLPRVLRSHRILTPHAGSNSWEFLSFKMEYSSQFTFRAEAKYKARSDPLNPLSEGSQ